MSRRRIAAGALVIGGIGLAAFVVAQFALAQQGTESIFIPGDARIVDRPNLSICVDGARGYTATQEDADSLQAALDASVGAFDGAPLEYGERVVVLGCPPPPAVLDEEPLDRIRLPEGDGWPGIDVPSVHRAFVYIIPAAVFEPFEPLPYVFGNAEMVCSSTSCRPVTTAIYLKPSTDATLLEEALLGAVGLQAPARYHETDE